MKIHLTRSLRALVIASTLPVMGTAVLADTPYVSNTQVLDTDITGSSVTVTAELTGTTPGDSTTSKGAVQAKDGEYSVTSTDGDIRITNSNLDVSGTSGVLANKAGAKLTVSNTNAASADSIYVQGRVGVSARNGGIVELTAANNGTVYLKGDVYEALSCGDAGTTVIVNSKAVLKGESSGMGAINGSAVVFHGEADVTALAGTAVNINGIGTTLSFKKNLNASSSEMGIYATLSSQIKIDGYTTVNSSSTLASHYGICAGSMASGGGNTSIELNGASVSIASNRALYAVGSGKITGNAAQYKIFGDIYAANDGEIDLHCNGNSIINGATYFKNGYDLSDSTGTINLTLTDQSVWQVTGNSQLTNLTLSQGSALQIAFNGSSLTDLITATGAITLETGSYIYLTGDVGSLQGNSFDFFTGTIDNQGEGVKFVGFDGTDWMEYSYTQSGNTFTFDSSAPSVIEAPDFVKTIPEPATATLGIFGLSALLFRRKRA